MTLANKPRLLSTHVSSRVCLMAVSSVVLPGDRLSTTDSVALGPGIRRDECGEAYSTVAGVVRSRDGQKIWIDFNSKRYVAVKGERVIGVVVKTGRVHKVDIGTAVLASLSELAFQGATRRNKPSLQVGQLVYAIVSRAHCHIEPEISCVDGSGKSDGLGPLDVAGFMIRCSLGLSRKLLAKPSSVLKALGSRLKFECVVGINGRVWVRSEDVRQTITIVNAIQNSEYMSQEQCHQMVEQMLEF